MPTFSYLAREAGTGREIRGTVDASNEQTAVAALLTGMGADGAKGMLAMKEAGAYTIAQNEETCVVYGMPREAVKLDAATDILPLDKIADALLNALRPTRV